MRRKNDEYVPQFDYSNFIEEETKTTYAKCLVCGNESPSLKNGVCFACRKIIRDKDEKSAVKHPNCELYLEWCEENAKEKANMLRVGIIFLPFFKYGFGVIWFLIAIWLLITFIPLIDQGTFSEIILLVSIILSLVIIGVLSIIGVKKRRIKKFDKYNKMSIKLESNGDWVCPCCHKINERISFCEECGVFPTILK